MSVEFRGRPKAKTSVPPQNAENGFFQSWYPVALSTEVAPGQVIGKPLLDGKVAVFRGTSGHVSVVSAYCRHLGADLSGGTVIRDYLRCPYHHWSYDGQGRCNSVPFDKPPAQAKLFKFPTIEELGLIWAFNGEEPLFEFPGITGYRSAPIAYRIADMGVFPVEAWMLSNNTFDIAHLKALHGLKVTWREDAMVEYPYSVTMGSDNIDRNFGGAKAGVVIHGSNITMIPNTRPEAAGTISMTLHALAPIAEGRVHYYLLSAVPLRETQAADDPDVQLELEQSEKYMMRLIEEDRPIMQNIRFKNDVLIDADRYINKYIDWLKRYPRAHPSKDYIT
jgi:phenylpropionate dioxygenase-like ring-hydroxylating dioxygenase large terminal subunit